MDLNESFQNINVLSRKFVNLVIYMTAPIRGYNVNGGVGGQASLLTDTSLGMYGAVVLTLSGYWIQTS